jgi:hypothetical protein
MAFTTDKIPEIVRVSKKLTDNFRPDMALVVGVGAPETQVFLFLTSSDKRRW